MTTDICCAAGLWGSVSAATAAVNSYNQLLAVRVILGVSRRLALIAIDEAHSHVVVGHGSGLLPRCDLLSECLVYQEGAWEASSWSVYRSATSA